MLVRPCAARLLAHTAPPHLAGRGLGQQRRAAGQFDREHHAPRAASDGRSPAATSSGFAARKLTHYRECSMQARSPEAGTGRANESTSNQATPGRTSSGQRRRPSAGSLLSALVREPPYFPGLLRLPSNKTLLFPPPRSAQPRPSEPSILVGPAAPISLSFSCQLLDARSPTHLHSRHPIYPRGVVSQPN